MDAEEILTQAKSGTELPRDWAVFPLLRSKVITAIVGWFLGIVIGLGLFSFIASLVIPVNYEHSVLVAIITTILLGVFLFIGLGSVYLICIDILRLKHIKQHIIVITPQDFVKQEGKRVIHVPLTSVRNITARGIAPLEHTSSTTETQVSELPSAGENMLSLFIGRRQTPTGRRWYSKRKRTPTTLAFMDARTDKEVIVVSDSSYGDHFSIGATLKQFVARAIGSAPSGSSPSYASARKRK